MTFQRFPANPILRPDPAHPWEAKGAFNGCPIMMGEKTFLLYRAQGTQQKIGTNILELSTIGCAESLDRVSFTQRRQLIKPEFEWEKFGCEDPRVTKVGDMYYIFYTALSDYPHTASGIKVAVALTQDFNTILEKHLVTPFNAKAMALFPDKVSGKLVGILSVNTDRPPAEIGVIEFDEPEQIWDHEKWEAWYNQVDLWTVPLLRSRNDQVEVGAPPLKTDDGWVLLFSYIHNYLSNNKTFAVEAALLDSHDPRKVLSRTNYSLLTPEEDYERYGQVGNIVFPSGAIVRNGDLGLYYGASDTNCCLATASFDELLQSLKQTQELHTFIVDEQLVHRYSGNPIISPIAEHDWESRYTFNPTAVYDGGKVHILYRAMGQDDTSVVGYASSKNGYDIDERLGQPIYIPRAPFEQKVRPGNSGCEDARITKFGDIFYMCYTAYDGKNPTRVALTSISEADFLAHKWNWSMPQLISRPDIDDKNSCIFPEKIGGKYAFFHRVQGSIWLDLVDDLNFGEGKWLQGDILMSPRPSYWDSEKIGITGHPIKTSEGWLLIYHGLSHEDLRYRLSAVLLDLKKPMRIISRLKNPILEPITTYENSGFRPGTVFSCGSVVMKDTIYIYYGGGDTYSAVAQVSLKGLLKRLLA